MGFITLPLRRVITPLRAVITPLRGVITSPEKGLNYYLNNNNHHHNNNNYNVVKVVKVLRPLRL